MFKRVGAILLASGVLLLAFGCSPKPATPTINTSMTKVMQPDAQAIWDIASAAFNPKGDGLDGSKISDADWDKVAKAAQQLEDRALVLAKAPHVTVAGPGETILGEEASGETNVKATWKAASAKEVQAAIDADMPLFDQRARILADAGAAALAASKTHDAAALYKMSAGLDEVCDGCHEKFWGTDDPPPFPH